MLDKNAIYRIAIDKVIMISAEGENITDYNWYLFTGSKPPMQKEKILREREVLEAILKAYQSACDLFDLEYEIVYIEDINTRSEIDHMIDIIGKLPA